MKILLASNRSYGLHSTVHTCFQAKDEEHSFSLIEKKKPDVMIIEKEYIKKMKWQAYILTIRTRYPNVIIIIVLPEESMKMRNFLYQWTIFNVIISSNEVEKEVGKQLQNPLKFSDVRGFYGGNNNLAKIKKILEKYAFFEENKYFLSYHDEEYAVEYYFSDEKNDNDHAFSVLIPSGKESWKYDVEVCYKGEIPKSVEPLIQRAKEVFEMESRLKRILQAGGR